MRNCKTRVLAGLAVLLLLTLTGCARPPQEEPDDKLLLGFSQLGSESGWRIANSKSITGAADRADIRLMFDNANQSQESQIKALKAFIAYKVDAIVFSPIVEEGWDDVLRAARAADIPVIVEDRFVNVSDQSLYVCHIGSDFYSEGVKAGEFLLKKLSTLDSRKTLNVVEITGTEDSTPTLQRSRAFWDTVKNEPRIRKLDSVCGDFLISKGRETVRDLLAKYGADIDVVYSHNDSMMYGAVEAIEEYGLTPGKDIIIISVDGEDKAINLLKAGKVNCVVECTPKLGDMVMQVVRDVVAGKPVKREIYSHEVAFTEFDDLDSIAPRGY